MIMDSIMEWVIKDGHRSIQLGYLRGVLQWDGFGIWNWYVLRGDQLVAMGKGNITEAQKSVEGILVNSSPTNERGGVTR